ncbi:MAG: hypothetical protein D6738_09685 [Acidobacteria bacterium]|nr:MAG: hypothetical protein D6738_09685 [Acidobacteriota bacterium]
MARCPECGGSVGPLDYLAARPGPVRCRWCNARLELPRAARRARDAVLVVLGAASLVGGTVLWIDRNDWIWLLAALGGLLASALAALLVEAAARPFVRAGRSVSPIAPAHPHDAQTHVGEDEPVVTADRESPE